MPFRETGYIEDEGKRERKQNGKREVKEKMRKGMRGKKSASCAALYM